MLIAFGEIEIRVLDINTLNIINVIKQHNVITKRWYDDWISDRVPITDLYISESTAPSYEDWPAVSGCITGSLPAGVVSPQLFSAVGDTPAYIQFMRRFTAPGTTRYISTILLTRADTITFTQYMTPAYVKLATPCTQTTSQILDVYYRIQMVNTTTGTYNYYNSDPVRTLLSILKIASVNANYLHTDDQIPSYSGICQLYSNVSNESNITPTANGAMYPIFDGAKSQYSLGITANKTYSVVGGYISNDWTLSTSKGIGHIHAALSMNNSGAGNPIVASANINISNPNGSKIQPIFSHANSTLSQINANPFLDSAPSTGTGIFNMSGTWTSGNLPELYKIDIVTGGNVGTATYKFSKRNHFGFCGTSYMSNIESLAGIYNSRSFTTDYITKPYTCGNYWSNEANYYGFRMERYDDTRLITHTSIGVSRYNCTNNYLEVWNNTSTPVLNTSNIRQASVNQSDGSIWVACATTGIWRINASGTIINNFTVATGLPSNQCYAVDIGRNNTIWIVYNGGIASSADNGASWTSYDTTTTPAFNSAILTNDWASVHYMRVDPTHANDRLCIVRYADCALNTFSGFVWWNRETGTTSVLNTSTVPDQLYKARRSPMNFNVSDNNSIWSVYSDYNGGSVYILSFGTTSLPTRLSSISTPMGGIMFVRDSANTQDLLMVGELQYTGVTSYTVVTNSSPSFYYIYKTSLYTSSGTKLSTITAATTLTQNLLGGYVSGTSYAIYLGKGVIAGYTAFQAGTSPYAYAVAGFISVIPGDGTPAGGALEYLIWENYGWDGTQWVLNNANAKTSHTDDQLMLNGINAKFTDSGSGTSFIAGDYYTGSVNDGILKNNAMTLSESAQWYAYPTQIHTDFDGVVRIYPWTTGVVNWRKVSASLTVNGDNSLTNNIPYRSFNLTAGSKNRVFGDFNISGTFVADSLQYYSIGISSDHHTEIPGVLVNQYSNYAINVSGNTVQIIGNTGNVLYSSYTISGPTTWVIARAGNSITFTVAGTVRYTIVDSSYSFMVHIRFNNTTNGTHPFTVAPITINSSGVGYYTGLGNNTNGTGIYNTKQMYASIINTTDILLDGTPLLGVNQTAGTAPMPGGTSLAREEGLLFFDATDVGKTVTGSYVMSYQVSTPCNVIPI